jgi:hypothetical protein
VVFEVMAFREPEATARRVVFDRFLLPSDGAAGVRVAAFPIPWWSGVIVTVAAESDEAPKRLSEFF